MVEWLWVGSDGDLCFCWEGKEMSEIIELLYPIYLDIPMMISFVATMDGGYSLEKVWKRSSVGSCPLLGIDELITKGVSEPWYVSAILGMGAGRFYGQHPCPGSG